MQIRQLEALQNMARAASSKVLFGACPRAPVARSMLIHSPHEPRRNGCGRYGQHGAADPGIIEWRACRRPQLWLVLECCIDHIYGQHLNVMAAFEQGK
jgi:hypothetical protein